MSWRAARRIFVFLALSLLLVATLLMVFPAWLLRPALAGYGLAFERVEAGYGRTLEFKFAALTWRSGNQIAARADTLNVRLDPFTCLRGPCVFSSLELGAGVLDFALLAATDWRDPRGWYGALLGQLSLLDAVRDRVTELKINRLELRNLQAGVHLSDAKLVVNSDRLTLAGNLGAQPLRFDLTGTVGSGTTVALEVKADSGAALLVDAKIDPLKDGSPFALSGRAVRVPDHDFAFDLRLAANGGAHNKLDGTLAKARANADLQLDGAQRLDSPSALILALTGVVSIPRLELPGVTATGIEVTADGK